MLTLKNRGKIFFSPRVGLYQRRAQRTPKAETPRIQLAAGFLKQKKLQSLGAFDKSVFNCYSIRVCGLRLLYVANTHLSSLVRRYPYSSISPWKNSSTLA